MQEAIGHSTPCRMCIDVLVVRFSMTCALGPLRKSSPPSHTSHCTLLHRKGKEFFSSTALAFCGYQQGAYSRDRDRWRTRGGERRVEAEWRRAGRLVGSALPTISSSSPSTLLGSLPCSVGYVERALLPSIALRPSIIALHLPSELREPGSIGVGVAGVIAWMVK